MMRTLKTLKVSFLPIPMQVMLFRELEGLAKFALLSTNMVEAHCLRRRTTSLSDWIYSQEMFGEIPITSVPARVFAGTVTIGCRWGACFSFVQAT